MIRKIQKYGWRPSLPHNVKKFNTCHPMVAELPPLVDLRSKLPPVYDQGQLGSCVWNSGAGAVQFVQPSFMLSRLFGYYNTRVIEGDPDQDGGCEIHDAIQVISGQGCCPETEWPYDISQFATQPPEQCYTDALKDLIKDYSSVQGDIISIKQVLASGYPVWFGMTVYESFESPIVASTGIVPMPLSNEQQLGGHAMLLCGYNDATQRFYDRNSWGATWGQTGYCEIPYEYIQTYASDFWAIE